MGDAHCLDSTRQGDVHTAESAFAATPFCSLGCDSYDDTCWGFRVAKSCEGAHAAPLVADSQCAVRCPTAHPAADDPSPTRSDRPHLPIPDLLCSQPPLLRDELRPALAGCSSAALLAGRRPARPSRCRDAAVPGGDAVLEARRGGSPPPGGAIVIRTADLALAAASRAVHALSGGALLGGGRDSFVAATPCYSIAAPLHCLAASPRHLAGASSPPCCFVDAPPLRARATCTVAAAPCASGCARAASGSLRAGAASGSCGYVVQEEGVLPRSGWHAASDAASGCARAAAAGSPRTSAACGVAASQGASGCTCCAAASRAVAASVACGHAVEEEGVPLLDATATLPPAAKATVSTAAVAAGSRCADATCGVSTLGVSGRTRTAAAEPLRADARGAAASLGASGRACAAAARALRARAP